MSERENRISTTSDTGNICCPFFHAHSKTDIVCEGLIEQTLSMIRFRSEDEISGRPVKTRLPSF